MIIDQSSYLFDSYFLSSSESSTRHVISFSCVSDCFGSTFFLSDVNAHIRTCHFVRDSTDCSQEERRAYCRDVESCLILSQLQLILELPNVSSAARKQKCSGSSSELLTATLTNLETFSSTYCSLFPILSFVVRVSFSMLCVMHRFIFHYFTLVCLSFVTDFLSCSFQYVFRVRIHTYIHTDRT